MEIQGQESLSLRDALRHSTHLSIRWRHHKILRPTHDFLQAHLQEPDFFWFTSNKFLKRPALSFRDSHVKFLPGGLRVKVVPERTTYCVTWGVLRRVPSSVSASRLHSDASSWAKHLRNPKDQDDRKKGTLSNQLWLMRVTQTALLGSWVLQPIEGMMSLGTDFETHATWQGSVEEPAAKDFVARKVRTIKLNKVQGTSCKAIKCKERLGSHPEAVVRQATINLNSQVWKSLGDYLPEQYCIDLKACVTRENFSLRNFAWEEKVWFASSQRTFPWETFGERWNEERKPVLILVPGSHEHLASRKCIMYARNMGAHVRHSTRGTKGIKKTGWEIRFPRSRERREKTSK